ncbi:hypothetical protein R1sor_013377 [Riccia sorocarpa]|uniref:Uncharacterized protein n=1 Tax=Riccia sorocarpa TaxID=122646 RepID=A0ABD3H6Z1_9MARC
MQASGKKRIMPTCIGIVVLHILRTCGIADDEDIVLSDSIKSYNPGPREGRASKADLFFPSPSNDEPLVGFGLPVVAYVPDDDEEEVANAYLTSLGAADPATAKGKRFVDHKSSSESEEIRNAKPDRVKRQVADPPDEADGPDSQQA